MPCSPYHILFKRHWVAIVRYCNKIFHDTDMAKDLAQMAFISLYEKMPDLQSDANAKAFLYVCARNRCYNQLQILGRRRTRPINDTLDMLEGIDHELPNWDFDVIESDVMEFIAAQIKEMPKARRAVIRLFFKGIDSSTIARKLGITRKTALNQKLTALAQLKTAVKLKYNI